MKIELKHIKIADLVKGYQNKNEDGVVGYDGKLDIRPKYQREFVYKEGQRNEVINTIRKGFPLNIMYWIKNTDTNDNEVFEVLDGQQRTISICEYIEGNYSINYQYFHNLTEEEKNQILDYELTVYFCEGNEREKLEWFKTINIAGEKLTEQELRNAVYTGVWLTCAKKHFSQTGCPAYGVGSNYLTGSPIRQDYLEKVLTWISNGNIEDYMSKHQNDNDCSELWQYFQQVISWVKIVFPNYRKEMKSVEWGLLYNQFKDNKYNSTELEEKIKQLMQDEDVTKKSGIYHYLLSGDEKYLNLRAFTDKQKREAYERQQGICPITQKHYDIKDMEADHIIPWSKGGKTTAENCQMIEKNANRTKSNK